MGPSLSVLHIIIAVIAVFHVFICVLVLILGRIFFTLQSIRFLEVCQLFDLDGEAGFFKVCLEALKDGLADCEKVAEVKIQGKRKREREER